MDWSFRWDGENRNVPYWHQYDADDFDWDDTGPRLNYEKVCRKCEQYTACALRRHYEAKGYSLRTALLYLGDFCITSWDGDLPYSVVEQLVEISNYACNHMG